MLKQKLKRFKFLTLDQVHKLIEVMDSPKAIRDRAIFMIAFWRGLRASEVGLLQLEDYDPKTKQLLVRRLKGSNDTWFPITKEEIKYLEKWIKERGNFPGPLFISKYSVGVGRSYLDDLIKEYGPKANLEKEYCHFHILKHSICTYLVDTGLDLRKIQHWVGHKSIASTQRYADVSPRAMRDITELVEKQFSKDMKEFEKGKKRA